MTDERELLIGVDVGLKNMAVCGVRWPRAACGEPAELPRRLAEAIPAFQAGAEIVWWGVVDLSATPAARGGSKFADEVRAVSDFVRRSADLFRGASVVVVEQQMAPRMRAVAAALMSAVHVVEPGVPLVFQRSQTKLRWADLEEWSGVSAAELSEKYSCRKRVSVQVTAGFLGLPPRPPGGPSRRRTGKQSAAAAPPDTGFGAPGSWPLLFQQSGKQDDLADALLHALAYLAGRPPAAGGGPRKRRGRPPAAVGAAATPRQ